MRRWFLLLVALAAFTVVMAVSAGSAGAYGGGAGHDMWQIGLSSNCNNPSICGSDGTGGFWGWAEFDRSADGTTTWGDGQFAGCFHTVGGIGGPGGAGAGHTTFEITSWTIKPGSAGPHTFFATGVETDSFRGQRESFPMTDSDTGIPADPGHYSTADVFGFTAPGVAFQLQVAYRPAK